MRTVQKAVPSPLGSCPRASTLRGRRAASEGAATGSELARATEPSPGRNPEDPGRSLRGATDRRMLHRDDQRRARGEEFEHGTGGGEERRYRPAGTGTGPGIDRDLADGRRALNSGNRESAGREANVGGYEGRQGSRGDRGDEAGKAAWANPGAGVRHARQASLGPGGGIPKSWRYSGGGLRAGQGQKHLFPARPGAREVSGP
jgi:hypothetical protein